MLSKKQEYASTNEAVPLWINLASLGTLIGFPISILSCLPNLKLIMKLSSPSILYTVLRPQYLVCCRRPFKSHYISYWTFQRVWYLIQGFVINYLYVFIHERCKYLATFVNRAKMNIIDEGNMVLRVPVHTVPMLGEWHSVNQVVDGQYNLHS